MQPVPIPARSRCRPTPPWELSSTTPPTKKTPQPCQRGPRFGAAFSPASSPGTSVYRRGNELKRLIDIEIVILSEASRKSHRERRSRRTCGLFVVPGLLQPTSYSLQPHV